MGVLNKMNVKWKDVDLWLFNKTHLLPCKQCLFALNFSRLKKLYLNKYFNEYNIYKPKYLQNVKLELIR